MSTKLSRRGFLEVSGVALGGLALGCRPALDGQTLTTQQAENTCGYPVGQSPGGTLARTRWGFARHAPDLATTMRSFLGTGSPPGRLAQ
jgi:hypothetical protein